MTIMRLMLKQQRDYRDWETHKELKKINSLAFSLMYYIENLNELKNIRTKENFKLRNEIAKLKNGIL